MPIKNSILNGFWKLRGYLAFFSGNILIISLATFLISLAINLFAPFIPLYYSELGASDFEIGLLNVYLNALGVIIVIFGGQLADKVGRKRTFIFSVSMLAFSMVLFGVSMHWTFLFLALTLFAFNRMSQPVINAIVADSTSPNSRASSYGLLTTIRSVPLLFAPYLGAFLIENASVGGFRISFFISLILIAIAATISFLKLRETISMTGEKNHPQPLGKIVTRKTLQDMISIFKQMKKPIRVLLVGNCMDAFAGSMFGVFSVLYVVSVLHVSTTVWATLLILSSALWLLLSAPFGQVIDKKGRKPFVVLSSLLLILSMILFILAQFNFYFLLIFAVVSGIELAAIISSALALMMDFTPKELRGRVSALFLMSASFFAIPAPIVGGFLYEINPQYPFYLTLAIYAIMFPLYLFGLRISNSEKTIKGESLKMGSPTVKNK